MYEGIRLLKEYTSSAVSDEKGRAFAEDPYGAYRYLLKELCNKTTEMSNEAIFSELEKIVFGKEKDASEEALSFVKEVANGLGLSNSVDVSVSDAATSFLLPMLFWKWREDKVCYRVSVRDLEGVDYGLQESKGNIPGVFWIELSEEESGSTGMLVAVSEGEGSYKVGAFSFGSASKKFGVHFAETQYGRIEKAFSYEGVGASLAVCVSTLIGEGFFKESDLTKKTYKRSSKIRDKFSEVRIYELERE